MEFNFEHIKYHLHYSMEYRPDRLRKIVNSSEILDYLLSDLDRSVEEAVGRRVKKWKSTDREYIVVAVGDLRRAQGLENMLRLYVRKPVFAVMAYA